MREHHKQLKEVKFPTPRQSKYNKSSFGVISTNKYGYYSVIEIQTGFREIETAPNREMTRKEFLMFLYEACGFEDFILFSNIKECWEYIGKLELEEAN